MLGISEIIRYINRDELPNCVLFELIVREIRELEQEFFPAAEVNVQSFVSSIPSRFSHFSSNSINNGRCL